MVNASAGTANGGLSAEVNSQQDEEGLTIGTQLENKRRNASKSSSPMPPEGRDQSRGGR